MVVIVGGAGPQIQAVNNGRSAFIDAAGRVERLTTAGAQNADTVFTTAKGAATPFARWGNAPLTALLVALLAAAALCRRRRK